MKKILLLTFLGFFSLQLLNAQAREFKVSKRKGTLKVNLSGVKLEGYDGNEIIFSAPERKVENTDERAAGLKMITASGLSDNTGLNLSVRENGDVVDVNYVSQNNRDLITIKVPNSMNVKINTSDVINAKKLDVKNFKGELEINAVYNSVSLENVTGPINANTIYGSLDAKFSQVMKGPISLVAMYKYADVTIPGNLKANVNLSTQFGNIFAADTFDIKRDKAKSTDKDAEGLTDWSRNTDIVGTINGGGLDLIIKSSYGKIYLRKGN